MVRLFVSRSEEAAMTVTDTDGLALSTCFADLEDPRIERCRRHELFDILVITICAVICDADDWTEIAAFGEAKETWFKTFLDLPNGIPSHDTFGRVFARLDPVQFEACFLTWATGLGDVLPGSVIAVDGKTVRRSHDRTVGKGPIHLVSAWATENGLSLGQLATEEKSNEITAIPELLRLVDIKGAALYYVTSLAFDPASRTLFFTSDNNNWRDLNILDRKTGESRRV